MALERQRLHDDLVAVIAASRELPSEHDHVLADVFLASAFRTPPPPPPKRPLLEDPRSLRAIAASCLAAAVLALALLAFHSGDAQGREGPVFAPSTTFVPDHGWAHDGYWEQQDGH